MLAGLVPEIVSHTENFYCYDYVPGKLLSEEVSVLKDFRLLLNWSQQMLWKPIKLSREEQNNFENICFGFYSEKTLDRLDMFYTKYNFKDRPEIINGVSTPELSSLLDLLDWSDIKRGIPVLFHGDYHFENILRTETGFKLLDWRQGFGEEMKYGDLYYDLGKLLHGLIVNHAIIRDNKFTIQIDNQHVKFDFHQKYSLMECERYFHKFVQENGWSWERTGIIAALIFLNIASLHHYPYSHFLYYLGKSLISEILSKKKNNNYEIYHH
jgi:thiamine kinase-like enzyme